MVAFAGLLASVAATDLTKLSQDKVLKAFANHRLMADYAVLLLYQASEALVLKEPDIALAREILDLGILTIQTQRIAFFQATNAGFEISKRRATNQGKVGANALHDKEGGSRWKQNEIKRLWQTGKYSSRDRCAEEECGGLDMSYSAARKALRNLG